MSKTPPAHDDTVAPDGTEQKTRRQHLWELAMSDRDTAPIYQAYYEREYGVSPADDPEMEGDD